MTIRRKLSLAFAVILILFGVNLAIYFWGAAERDRAVHTLSRALTRVGLIANIRQKLDDLQKQITILSGINIGSGAAAASPQEIHQFTTQLNGVAAGVGQLRTLSDDPAERAAVGAFAATFGQLSQSWIRYYQDFGTHQDLAVIELALHGDPLSAQLFERRLPELVRGEQIRVRQAKANFARASLLTGRISVGIFLFTLLAALFIALRVWREVATALGDLTLGAAEWGRGQLDHRLPARQDEFGQLGLSFNNMAASLRGAQDIVRQRTAELEASNRQLAETNQQIERQKKVSEDLLLNILPAPIAGELQEQGSVAPKYFEDVTILFTDFVGFTRASEALPVEELIHRLHRFFTRFDQIMGRYGLEKLKTIGDAYMCAGGIPVKNSSHPVDAVLAAFAILEAVASDPEFEAPWPVRIGIHTGPVAAGVVGIHKFSFDLWGDTVNFASRLEATGEPNRINISAGTHARI
ncbi:MAG: adenylate/guanylate cyclase domain-containing protein, partial [Terriglobales bacterium]